MTGDESYHAACFTCKTCARHIGELVFAKTTQGIYCMACHNERVARSRRHAEQRRNRSKSRRDGTHRDRDKDRIREKPSNLHLSEDGVCDMFPICPLLIAHTSVGFYPRCTFSTKYPWTSQHSNHERRLRSLPLSPAHIHAIHHPRISPYPPSRKFTTTTTKGAASSAALKVIPCIWTDSPVSHNNNHACFSTALCFHAFLTCRSCFSGCRTTGHPPDPRKCRLSGTSPQIFRRWGPACKWFSLP